MMISLDEIDNNEYLDYAYNNNYYLRSKEQYIHYKRKCNMCYKIIDINTMFTLERSKIHLCIKCSKKIIKYIYDYNKKNNDIFNINQYERKIGYKILIQKEKNHNMDIIKTSTYIRHLYDNIYYKPVFFRNLILKNNRLNKLNNLINNKIEIFNKYNM